ncbi:flagellar hook-length control protein FliK [Bacillus litorisediminis]|uniref:flagellar hook-length control protein FliK n=1 Tax=Bacillus litorisediminis TaxID=2922713 RepID=UPI001FAC064A|nr:flagellar hook-length control protein FliK [Bacillus litorisediminis]
MNVASIQTSVQLSQPASHPSKPGKTKEFAAFLQAATKESTNLHSETANDEPISQQDIKDLLVLLSLEPGTDNKSILDWLNGSQDAALQLESFLFAKEEDIPFELFAFLQNVTSMSRDDLLSFLSAQTRQMDMEQVTSFENWANIAGLIETSLSKSEVPNQATLKLLEILKAVELAGSRLSLPANEAAALEQLQQSLGKIRVNLNHFLNQSQKQPFYDRILETFRTINKTGNEQMSEKLSLSLTEKQAVISGMNETSTKTFEGNLSFMTQIKQPIVTNSQINAKPVTFEQFTEILSKLMQKGSFSDLNGTQKLLVKLHPEHLGSLRIELIRQDGVLTAKLLTSTQAAKELIESQLHGFRNALGTSVQIDKIEVIENYTQQQERSFYNKEQQHQQSQHQQNQQKNNSQSETEQIQFHDVLFELIV